MATKKNTTINGKDYYRIRRTIDGKVKAFYGSSKHDAEQQYKLYLERIAEEKFKQKVKLDTATIEQRATEYVDTVLVVSTKYAKGTIDRYKGCFNNYIKGSKFANLVAQKVRPSDVQQFYNSLDVSMNTLKAIHKFMRAFSKWMVLCEYSTDFLSAVELPRKEENHLHDDIVVWSDDEIHTILTATSTVEGGSLPVRAWFMPWVMFYTGVRISEAISLRYTDFRNGYVNVERQCYRGEIKQPKYNSVRKIPIHKELQTALDQHRKWHKQDMKENGYKTDLVFTTSTGQIYSPSSLRKSFVRFYDKIGVEYKHFHAYRATFCTQMCRCGVPMEVTSKLMGHKNLEVTARHYALVREDSMEEAMSRLDYGWDK